MYVGEEGHVTQAVEVYEGSSGGVVNSEVGGGVEVGVEAKDEEHTIPGAVCVCVHVCTCVCV